MGRGGHLLHHLDGEVVADVPGEEGWGARESIPAGQPGVTELPAGAEGEGGEPGQAAGQEQQAGVGDAAPGAAA